MKTDYPITESNCPACNSDNLVVANTNWDDDDISQDIECMDCDTLFVRNYKAVFTGLCVQLDDGTPEQIEHPCFGCMGRKGCDLEQYQDCQYNPANSGEAKSEIRPDEKPFAISLGLLEDEPHEFWDAICGSFNLPPNTTVVAFWGRLDSYEAPSEEEENQKS